MSRPCQGSQFAPESSLARVGTPAARKALNTVAAITRRCAFPATIQIASSFEVGGDGACVDPEAGSNRNEGETSVIESGSLPNVFGI